MRSNAKYKNIPRFGELEILFNFFEPKNLIQI